MADSKISNLTELTTVDKDNDLLAIVDTSGNETKKVKPANLPISDAVQTALDSKEASVSAGTTGQYYRGDKSWQTLNKSAVGLGNVDNTSDADKPVSTATQTALDLKANIASPTFTGTVTSPAVNVSGQTASRIASIDASKNVVSLDTATYPSLTELAYVKGATSSIQTQLTTNANNTTTATTEAKKEYIMVACSDETTALTTGTAKATFRIPFAGTLTGIRASLTTAQGSGSILTVDVNKNGTTVLSTKLTIDNTEKTSTTAATPPVISVSSIADDDEFTIDIDQVGTSGATGLKVTLIISRT